MATQHLTFTGVAEWVKVWPGQIDRGYETDARGGNWSLILTLNDEDLKTYNALGVKIHPDVKSRQPKVKFTRHERHAVLGDLGAPVVTGVDTGNLIGNGSTLTIDVEVYDYTYNKKPGRAVRLTSVNVDELVEYVKPEPASKPAVGVPVH